MDHAEFYQHKSVVSFLRSIVAQLFGWVGWIYFFPWLGLVGLVDRNNECIAFLGGGNSNMFYFQPEICGNDPI